LQILNVNGVLVQMAKNGQILKLRCEMPTCYCPEGRKHFVQRIAPPPKWSPNADHYPTLKKDNGRLQPSNVRLAHVYCNNMDYGWRSRVRAIGKAARHVIQGHRRFIKPKGERPSAVWVLKMDGEARSASLRLIEGHPTCCASAVG
jgi:hypothetical protein